MKRIFMHQALFTQTVVIAFVAGRGRHWPEAGAQIHFVMIPYMEATAVEVEGNKCVFYFYTHKQV